MQTLEYAKQQLQTKHNTLTVLKRDASFETQEDSFHTILGKLREDKDFFSGSVAASRLVGRASALLLLYGGVREVYAETVSIPAVECFRSHRVKIAYDHLIDRISPKDNALLASYESQCLDISSPFQAYSLLCRLASGGTSNTSK